MMQNPRIFYRRYSFILKSGIACDIINKKLMLSKCNLYNLLQLTQKYKKGLLFMVLTKEQQALLDGEKGETMAKVMKTLVMYGEAFGAERMVPVTSKYGHTVISFGIGVMKPIYELYDTLLEAGAVSKQPFSADPRPLDKNVPSSFLQDIVFKFMYSQQERYESQLKHFGLMGDKAYTCACYLPEVGNTPKRGEILSWAESSAVVYANSALGARCNRNSGIIELMGSIAGFVPEFGLLTDEGRKADWIIEIKTTKKPEAQILGSAIGMKVMEKVPYIRGLDKWIGTELNDEACAYLKDFGAATASNGSVGLYHIENLTPEAVDYGKKLLRDNVPTYIIDDAELERVKNSYPCIWKDPNATPKLCFMGCPHMTLKQLEIWTERVENGLKESGNKKVLVPTVFTSAPDIIEEFNKTEYAERLKNTGVILSYICPLMYMNNPLSKKMPVITSSNKLRTYTSAKFYSDDEIVRIITKEGK
jgi:predicted aconitase